MNRIGLKIVCLVASIIIWVQVAATSVVEQAVNLPLRVVGVEEGLTVLGSDLPEKVEVRLEGSKLRLMSHRFLNRYLGEVRVNLADQPAGPPFSYELDRADVFTDLLVVGIQPPVRLRLHVDHLETRTLPVRLVTRNQLGDDLGYLVPPEVSPDSVRVTGPRSYFADDQTVATEMVDLKDLEASRDLSLELNSPHELLSLRPAQATASFRVAALEDRTLANIPVVALVDAGQPDVGVSPPVVDVMVRGVRDSIQALDRSRFLVTVPVGGLAEGVYTMGGQVDYPPWATLIGIKPQEVQVIVGNPFAAQADSLAGPTEDGAEDLSEGGQGD